MLPFLSFVGLQFMQECIVDGLRYLNLSGKLLSWDIKI